tara:strand:+ start:96 stop:449 length:354 start_codon:yes stop_codon:yes gene_type:complete
MVALRINSVLLFKNLRNLLDNQNARVAVLFYIEEFPAELLHTKVTHGRGVIVRHPLIEWFDMEPNQVYYYDDRSTGYLGVRIPLSGDPPIKLTYRTYYHTSFRKTVFQCEYDPDDPQ